MKKLNRKFALLMVLCLLFTMVLGACGNAASDAPAAGGNDAPGAEPEDKLVIGVLFDFLSVESRVRQHDTMVAYAEEMGVELVFQNANGDEKVQLQQGENLIAQGVDAIAILAQNGLLCRSHLLRHHEDDAPGSLRRSCQDDAEVSCQGSGDLSARSLGRIPL